MHLFSEYNNLLSSVRDSWHNNW